MKVIVCLDDNGGMTFGGRRQSRDKALLADISSDVNASGEPLLASPFSQRLLAEADISHEICDNPLVCAKEGQLCFIESLPLCEHIDEISELTVYRWNRKYPSDQKIDVDIDARFTLASTSEFKGNAHEKISKLTYAKR